MVLSFYRFFQITFCIFILGAPLLSWGFSIERTQSYLEQARTKKIWLDPQWLKLGHYRSKWNGGYFSPLQGHFFISPNGFHAPESELTATIEFLFSESTLAKHPQCHYLARMSWLKSVLTISQEDLLPCEEQDQWKRQLGASEVYIVFAASDLSSAASSFGHTFLRLHNSKNTQALELLDYGVNYAATTGTDTGALYALKGLFGYYQGTFSMLPFHQKIKEYSNLEGRDLWGYKLQLSEQQVNLLIDHLLELEGSYSKYYFADDNCSAQLLELLAVTQPNKELKKAPDIVLPLDTLKTLQHAGLLGEQKFRISLQSEWQIRYGQLTPSERTPLKALIENQNTETPEFQLLPSNKKAKSLEAAMSYLAIQEYRYHRERKGEKYKLAVARAGLGPVTQPPAIALPASPLSSGSSSAVYFGFGQMEHQDFYRFKVRRGFHDYISNDGGLTPFSHLELLSFDFQYKPALQNLELQEFVFSKILSTHPVTTLEHPMSWKFALGTTPKWVPYLRAGGGYSFDFPMAQISRWTLLGVSENENLTENADARLGIESLFLSKWLPDLRSLFSLKYSYSTRENRTLTELGMALSMDISNFEFRIEAKTYDQQDSWTASIIF